MEAADRDRHARLAKRATDIERARKLIRLHPDQRDHALIRQNAPRNGGNVDDGVALVVDLDLNIHVGAKGARFRAFVKEAVDTRERVRGNGRATPLNDVAVVVVMRRLDQGDSEFALRHARPWEKRTGVEWQAIAQGAPPSYPRGGFTNSHSVVKIS